MNEARLVAGALTDGVVKLHAGGRDAFLVEHLELEAVVFGETLRDLGEGFGNELVGRLVHRVARDGYGLTHGDAKLELLFVLARDLASDEHADLAKLCLRFAISSEVAREPVGAEHDGFANRAQ